MKIEVGDYIRTNRGVIAKIIDITYDETDNLLKWYWYWHDNMKRCINKPYITKCSKNIEDLLEIGDRVVFENSTHDIQFYMFSVNMIQAVKSDVRRGCILKSVLTHEQYEEHCFRL